jgi:electron transfer flavoprotein beta subunit
MIAACLKWVDRRPQVDSLTGAVHTEARTSGASDADLAALEWALRLGEAWRSEVLVLTAGPAASEPMLRDAVAAGAARALRVDADVDLPSASVARALAGALIGDARSRADGPNIDPAGTSGPQVVVCGAWSLDRGSGSVPAFLAAELGGAQALGLISLEFDADRVGALTAWRRLDGGRRERLEIDGPAVVSVEGGSARLRRASLPGVLAARETTVSHVPSAGGGADLDDGPSPRRSPYRPRSRVLPAPPATLTARQRVLALTGALTQRTPPQRVTLQPAEAADLILQQLHTWGYLT